MNKKPLSPLATYLEEGANAARRNTGAALNVEARRLLSRIDYRQQSLVTDIDVVQLGVFRRQHLQSVQLTNDRNQFITQQAIAHVAHVRELQPLDEGLHF